LGRLKIAVIGGGSVYTPELVEGFIASEPELPVESVTLMDIDPERLEIVGGLAERMASASGAEFRLVLTTDRRQALAGAHFVIAQLRVGGMAARILDETTPPRFGVVGQETTGPGGFGKALRTIPVMLDIGRDMEELCPEAFLINFTNPSGIVTDALLRQSRVRSIGLCNVPMGMRHMIAGWLEVDPAEVELDYVGLNHLSWVRGVRSAGRDAFDQVFSAAVARAQRDEFAFSAPLLETLAMIPSYYLRYYYHHDDILAEQKAAARPGAKRSAKSMGNSSDSMQILCWRPNPSR